MTPPELFDRKALARQRARAALQGRPETFVHALVADDLDERIQAVNRTFTAPCIVTGMPAFWSARFPDATIVADDDHLAMAPEAHDLVIHAMALHWANDPVGQIIQCRQALRPDGLFIAGFPGGETLRELRHSLAKAEIALCGGLSPRVAPMGEIRALGGLMQRAGLTLPVADSVFHSVSYADFFALASDLRAMGEGNAIAARRRAFTGGAVLREAARNYARDHALGDGRITATLELVFLTGWAPHPDQQKPLRPGTAARRLADALGAAEVNPALDGGPDDDRSGT